MIKSGKIKIGYFADGPWSHEAFKKIIRDENIEIMFIVCRTDTKDNTLKNFSITHNIDYLFPVKINSPEFLIKVKDYECDLFVSMSFNQIFRKEIISIPKKGVINCHAGKLPFYRGRNVLNWVLINDEKEFGITVHYIDEGIDTGDIINQRTFTISDSDDYKSLLEKAFMECANILYDTIIEIKNGVSNRIKQSTIHPTGFYCGGRRPGDENINWNSNSRDLFNFIRAICSPGPMATTFLDDIEVKINSAEIIEDSPVYLGIPGQILQKTDEFLIVKTLDSILKIKKFSTKAKIKIGNRFK